MKLARRRSGLAALVGLCAIVLSCSTDLSIGGRTTTEWIRQLSDVDARARIDAVNALSNVLRIDPGSQRVVDALVRALADSADAVRIPAGAALAQYGVRSSAAVPGLIAALGDSAHASVRSQAAGILGTLGTAAEPAVPALTGALADPDAEVRLSAAQALGLIGPSAASAVPALVRLSRDHDASTRVKAMEALMNVQASPNVAVLVFVTALGDSAVRVRMYAGYALGALGPRAAPAIDALARQLADTDPGVRGAAAFALGQIGTAAASAIPALRAVRDRDTSAVVAAQADDALAALSGRPRPREPLREPSGAEKCAGGAARSSPRC